MSLTQSDLNKIKLVVHNQIQEFGVTKQEAKNFATKNDLKNFATKNDLKNFATKNDLKNFATKNDLKPIKKDLKKIKKDLNLVIEVFDKNYLGLNHRVGHIENVLHIPAPMNDF